MRGRSRRSPEPPPAPWPLRSVNSSARYHLIAIRRRHRERAARLVRRVRIFQRHDALALADEHALSHDHGRFVADDDARMRRGRLDRVPSAQMIASPDSMPRRPSSQLTSTPCTGAGLRQRRRRAARRIADIKIENASARSIVMSPLRRWNRRHIQSSSVTGFRFSVQQAQGPAQKCRIIDYSMVVEISAVAAALTCKSRHAPFKRGHPERWPSGLRRTLGKRVCGKLYRGFESHSLRHLARASSKTLQTRQFVQARLAVSKRGKKWSRSPGTG